jgi:hypothetical protein
MATQLKQEGAGATALPIVRAFVEMGGRLMLNHKGKLEISGGLRWALPDISAKEARRSLIVERRLYRRLRDPRFARSIRCMILQDGTQQGNGWLVVEARS